MAYRDYRSPGVQVFLEQQANEEISQTSQFYPIYIGTGLTTRNRIITAESIQGDMADFPVVTLDVPVKNQINSQLFDETHFELTTLRNNKDVVATPAEAAVITGSAPDATVDLRTLDTNTDVRILVNNIRYTVDNASFSNLDGTHDVSGLVTALQSAVDKNGNAVTAVADIATNTDGNITITTKDSGSEASVAFQVADASSDTSDTGDIETAFGITNGTTATGADAEYQTTEMVAGTDYEVNSVSAQAFNDSVVTVTITVLNTTDVTIDDDNFTLEMTAENTSDDFDVRVVSQGDRYNAQDIFGPLTLEEDGQTVRNDVAIAADMAFRAGAPYFYYLEVPRDYGQEATSEDFVNEIEKVYFQRSAYRVVPLSDDPTVVSAVNGFVGSGANPIDKRYAVSFVSYDTGQINDMKNINELVEKVGGFSASLANKRTNNVFGGESIEVTFSGSRMVLPFFFMNVAISAMDTALGMVEPLSQREVPVVAKINGPRFRPGDWNKLASKGVWIVTQEDPNAAPVIRHQLTTDQSGVAESEEYSIVKNQDAVTVRFEDRLKPYAGRNNITDGYIEKVDGTLTGAIEEIKDEGLARSLEVITPWTVRRLPTQDSPTQENRNLFTRIKMEPVYPANNLDIHLLI